MRDASDVKIGSILGMSSGFVTGVYDEISVCPEQKTDLGYLLCCYN